MSSLPQIHPHRRPQDAKQPKAAANVCDVGEYLSFLESLADDPRNNSEVDDAPKVLELTRVELRTLQHKAFTTHGQRAGTLLLLFRHYARIGHHREAKKVSHHSKPQKMTYAGITQFASDWLVEGNYLAAEDVEQVWKAIMKGKLKKLAIHDPEQFHHLSLDDFFNFLMIAIIAFKKANKLSKAVAYNAFADLLHLNDRKALVVRLKQLHEVFVTEDILHHHDQLLHQPEYVPEDPPMAPVAAVNKNHHVRNFAQDPTMVTRLRRSYLYCKKEAAEAEWLVNAAAARQLWRKQIGPEHNHDNTGALLDTEHIASRHRKTIDLGFGVQIGKSYTIRLSLHLSRPASVVDSDDEEDDGEEPGVDDPFQAEQVFQVCTSPEHHETELRVNLQSSRQISQVPAQPGKGNDGGEEVELEVVATIRPTRAGLFRGVLSVRLTEGARRGREGHRYNVPKIPYFIFVQAAGIRRPNATVPLPMILNDHNHTLKPADLGNVERMREVVENAGLHPASKADSEQAALHARVKRAMHLAHTLTKTFNFNSQDESHAL